jgi:serine/threonine protein kinase
MLMELEGMIIGHYRVQERLARGGMSEVYLAQDEQTGQQVALKVVCHDDDEEYLRRFQREMTTLSKLAHEHILPVLEQGESGCWHYCVMPYLEQGTLRQRLTHAGPLSLQDAGRILQQVADALQCAHEQGILHRDLKPSNILLHDEQAYLADFGLAKELSLESAITQTGVLLGTPEYMAPELAEQPATISSDLYALGIVLYQMLTGRVPFRGHSPLSIYWKQMQEPPPPPSLFNPAIPPPVEQVMLRALAKDPAQRFPSAQALVQAYQQALLAAEQEASRLSSFQASLPLPSQRVIPLPPVNHGYSRLRVLVALAALLLLFVVPVVLGFALYANNSLSSHTPLAFGASAQFVNLGRTAEVPAPTTATRTPQPTYHTTSSVHPQVPSTPAHKPGGSSGHSGGGHSGGGHVHGHGHKHGHSESKAQGKAN